MPSITDKVKLTSKQPPADEVSEDEVESEEARAQRKAAKKEAKRARKAAEAAAAEAEEEDVILPSPAASEASEKSEKADKKDKKDKKEKKDKKDKADSASSPAVVFEYLKEPVSKVEATEFRTKHSITVVRSASEKILPFTKFSQLNLPADVSKCWGKFTSPTPIQAQAWPALFMGKDVIGIAETGSGKTFGFMLPALMHLRTSVPAAAPGAKRAHSTPSVLVLAPTRELAMQTQAVIDECRAHTACRSVCVYGGVDKGSQKASLRAGVDVVVATPGRLLAMINEQTIDVSKVTYFVLDEADRLLDMGFEPDVRAISAAIGPKEARQTLLFSATWPESVQKLGSELIRDDHVHIIIGREPAMVEGEDGKMMVQTDRLMANARITQTVEVIDDFHAKKGRLRELLKKIANGSDVKIIVFVLYKKEVPEIEREIASQGYKVAGLSSDYSQDQRTNALASFKSGKVSILVATDVAARGLDIPNVEHVVNYTFPLVIEDYVHRIGRTGRAGKTGSAWTFFNGRDNKHLAGSLQHILREAGQQVPEELLKFGTAVKRKENVYGGFSRSGGAPMGEKKHMKF